MFTRFVASIALSVALFGPAPSSAFSPDPAGVAVCFVPAEACQGAIVEAIRSARSEIRVQAYGFSAAPILAALVDAMRRGVDVRVLLDRSNEQQRNVGARSIVAAGVPVWVDWQPAIAHAKVIIVDRRLVVAGSYNFTASAERKNAEDVTFITSDQVAARFLTNWDTRFAASRPFKAAAAE